MENVTISVDYTVNEAQVLLEIIDIAVRSRGLSAAEAGLVLSKKIETKLKTLAPQQAPPQDPVFTPEIIKP